MGRVHATVVTLFPGLLEAFLETSVVGRGVRSGRLVVDLVDLRTFGEGAHRVVDDRPFGGGPGMVLMAEPVLRAVEAARGRHGPDVRTIVLSPQGRRFTQAGATDLAASSDGFVLVCGRYEGIDERALERLRPEEISIGDYVLSGGEVAAMVVLDAVSRLVPGVLGHADSSREDSFARPDGLLDHPHYTRPAVWRGREVPEVLLSGHHEAVRRWREAEARARTRQRRPDLLGEDAPGAEGDATCSPGS
jgi:tRNA (guanine37-N1)-methyltransferase